MFCTHKITSSNLVISTILILNSMKYILIPRSYTYYNILGKCDLLDKHNILYKSYFILANNNFSCNFFSFPKGGPNSLILKEFLTQRKLSFKKTNEKSLDYFITSLRKKHFFLYLDVLLNSLFLTNEWIFSHSNFLVGSHVLINSVFVNLFCTYSSLISNKTPNNMTLVNIFKQEVSTKLFMSYLLLPNLNLGE